MQLQGKKPAETAGIRLNPGKNKLLRIIEIVHMPKS